MNTRFATILAAAALCTLSACEDKKTPAGTGKTGATGTVDAAKGTATDAVQMAKDGILKPAGEQIEKVTDYVAKLKAQASKIAADQKPEFDKAVADIESGLTNVKAKVEELRKAGSEQWSKVGSEVSEMASKLYTDAKAAVDKWVK